VKALVQPVRIISNHTAVCPIQPIVAEAPSMLKRIIMILKESKANWPLASRWLDGLERFARDKQRSFINYEGSMADGVISV